MARKVKTPKPEPKQTIVNPKTKNQSVYIHSIRKSFITFCIGQPGTGKTFLAVAEALRALRQKDVKKIIISRPVIEAGEKLGYLPGRIEDKLKPYLVPVFEALKDFVSFQELAQLHNQGKLEICPLAYTRGRTFKDSFLILDEAQNATIGQIKMLLTRLGETSKAVICGDPKQSDIDTDDLIICAKALEGVPSITVVQLGIEDIIRHKLLGEIVQRLEDAETHRHNGNGRLRRVDGSSRTSRCDRIHSVPLDAC